MSKIVIIGAGNAGYQLSWHLHNSGHDIIQVFSRHLPAARWIGNLMDIPCTNDISEITQDGDIYLVSVKDDAIEEVAKQLRLKDKIVAHTSGSVPLNALAESSSNYGIFYPLQTLSRNVSIDFSAIPVCIDANNDFTRNKLKELAATLTSRIIDVNDEQRLAIHIAAVFSNNFTNHLFHISEMILKNCGLSFDILKPLIHETVRKIQNHDPANVQTGPALRNDIHAIERHIGFLKSHNGFAELYEQLTQSIRQHATEKV